MSQIPIIEFENARLGYAKGAVLDKVDCRIEKGSFTALVGPNGSGKTTFLKAVLGLLPPISGRVAADRSRPFAYVPQADSMNLYWPLTVRETVSLAMKASRWIGKLTDEEEARVDSSLKRAGIFGLAEKPLKSVSGGQRQRTVLAQALVQKPAVLLLDEPTRGLDVVAERDFFDLVSELNKEEKMTVLFVTHTLHAALDFAQEIFLFKDGDVIRTDPDELVRTERLQEIYGIPFAHGEENGHRWLMPKRRADRS